MTRNLVISLVGFFSAIFAVPATAQPVADLSVEILGSGSVIGDPPGIDCPSECDASYAKKASVILEARAVGGLSFVGWIGDCVGISPICELKLNKEKHAIAVFESYPAPVPKTGTTNVFAPGDDGDLQLGITWPVPRFTDNGDGTIADNLTGLVWLKDVLCIGPEKFFDAFILVQTLNDGFNFACTDYVAGSATDWRIPNIKELLSLADYGFFLPAISNAQGDDTWSQGDPFVGELGNFLPGQQQVWSSTVQDDAPIRFIVATGEIQRSGFGGDFQENPFVWPVRGAVVD